MVWGCSASGSDPTPIHEPPTEVRGTCLHPPIRTIRNVSLQLKPANPPPDLHARTVGPLSHGRKFV
jgi:hypothetical protein